MGFNSTFKGLKLLKPWERAFKQFKWPRPQCVKCFEHWTETKHGYTTLYRLPNACANVSFLSLLATTFH